MKKYIKKSVLLVCILTLLFGGVTSFSTNVAAQEVSDKVNSNELINIVDPYIKETRLAYKVKNEKELIQKIGYERVKSLKAYLIEASKDKERSLGRDAVHFIHMHILRYVGASVTSHWWGKRIITRGKAVTEKVRELASLFSTYASTAGLAAGLISIGLAFVPGAGTAAAIAGAVTGIISWADSLTWSKVSEGMLRRMNRNDYYLTIDINAWNMEVKVY